jgi:peptide deformylase
MKNIKQITTATPEGEAFLRQTSKPIDFKNAGDIKLMRETADILVDFCNQNSCYAMAAPQLGKLVRMMCIKHDQQDLTVAPVLNKIIVNPEIIEMTGETEWWESCMSCIDKNGNGDFARVKRPYIMKLRYRDLDGKEHADTFEGFIVTALNHERDHLDGILHRDRAEELLTGVPPQERNERRKTSPYKIFRKTGRFTYAPLGKK